MSMKKISELQLETTANYQPKSKLNVRLWNQDLGVSVLRFLVTRDNFPLSLSSSNVKMIIVLENGRNFVSSDEFDISSEVDGVASFQIPNDFMNVAEGTVTAQCYVGTIDNDEVVVMRQFTFEVSNDLLSSIPSELKLQYIKTFSDLSDSISTRLLQVEEDMATMEDYVVAVNQATTDGLNALNNLVNAKTVEYNDNHADKLALINNTVDGYVQDFLDQRSYIDTKYAEFQTAVGGSGLVTTGSAANWQKYKLTLDNGDISFKIGFDFNDINGSGLKSGFYIISNGINAPVGVSNYGYLRLLTSGSNYAEATYRPYDSNKVYVAYKWSSATEWTPFTTPTQNMETLTGSQSKANVAENNAKVYADSKIDEQHAVLFSGSVNGVGSSINLTSSLYDYNMIVISGSYFGGTIHETVLPAAIGPNVVIQRLNLGNTDGMVAFAYEMSMDVISGTKLTIARDVAHDMFNQVPSGPNKNAFIITRIEGFK